MSESSELASWIELEGCYNFRDLGSYQTADGRRMVPGRVYRSDGLQHLKEADLARLCDELRLAVVIDLRSQDEVEEDGLGLIADRAKIHPVPLFSNARGGSRSSSSGAEARGDLEAAGMPLEMPSNMADLYYVMLVAAREPIVRVVSLLAELDVPAVFHCSAGKDRTGVISAILLSILGIPEDTIIADYAFSRQNIDLINQRLGESQSYQRFMHELPDGAYDADPEAMRAFLARVAREHGSMAGWAAEAGIDEAMQSAIRNRLLS